MSIVYTGGTFDLFHSGHVNFLKRCREVAGEGGVVVVSLNLDDFVYKFKNKYPVCTYEEREAVLLATKYVDVVVPNISGADSKPSIEKIKPDYIIVGSDWARKDYYAQMQFTQDWLDDRGIGLIYIPYTKEVSSTNIRGRMNK